MQDSREDGVITILDMQSLLGKTSLPNPSRKKISLGLFSFQEKDVTPDKNLLSKVREAALWLETSDSRLAQPSHSTTASIADFFLALTICNSVMVSTTTEPRKRVRTDDGWEWGQGREKSGKANRKRKIPDLKADHTSSVLLCETRISHVIFLGPFPSLSIKGEKLHTSCLCDFQPITCKADNEQIFIESLAVCQVPC